MDAHAKGDMDGLESTGALDVGGLSLFLADVFEKKAGAELKVGFTARLVPKAFTIKARANVAGRELTLLNAWLFRDGLKLALGNRVTSRQLDAAIRPGNRLTAAAVRGVMDYDTGFVSFRDFAAEGLADADGAVTDARFTGSFDLNKLIVRWDVSARLSAARSQALLKAAPALAARLDADGRLPFRFRVEGPMDQPRVLAAPPQERLSAVGRSDGMTGVP
jgi:hypothetical protein